MQRGSSFYPEIFEQEKLIISNRGTYAYIMLIGSLNTFEVDRRNLALKSTPQERFLVIQKYLKSLLDKIEKLSDEEEQKYLTMFASGADTKWFRFFQSIVNENFPEYEPEELIDWKERQDEELQDKGRKYGEDIERFMKKTILHNMESIYGDEWELEITNIMNECQKRQT